MQNNGRECSICDYSYDMGNKKPLALRCGHSFCSGCLSQMKRANNAQCPVCRGDWSDQEVDQLVVVYQLVSGVADVTCGAGFHHADACNDHSIRMAFWCKSCVKAACNICLGETHKLHDWVLLEPALNEGRDALDDTRAKILDKVHNKSGKIVEAVTKNNDQIATLRMFKLAVRDLESNMTAHEGVLQNLQTNLIETRDMVQAIRPETFEYQTLERLLGADRVAAEDIPIGPATTLFDVARSYQELGEDVSKDSFLTKFCLVSQSFNPNENWTVKDNGSSTGALIALTNSNLRPSRLILEFDQDVPELRVSCILSVAALECPEIVVRFLKDFWEPSTTSIARTNERLDKLFVDGSRTHLEEFAGHLDAAGVSRLPVTHLRRLGLALTSSQDQMAAANAVTEIKGQGVLQELHLSVAAEVNPGDVGELSPDLRDGFPLHLHFPKMTDDGLQKMVFLTKKLMAGHNNSDRIRRVYMPKSSLTVRGVELLLGVLHGTDITKALYVEAPNISSLQRTALNEMADSLQLTLSWNDKDLWSLQ